MEGSDSPSAFYLKAVGIWLAHRDLWHECGGYDERMIYMNGMEANMMHRLMKKYPMVDLGRMIEHDFYHLEHYHPWAPRRTSTHRKVNPHLPFWAPERMNPNGEGWGLAAYPLEQSPTRTGGVPASQETPAWWKTQYLFLILAIDAQGLFDGAIKAAGVWRKRARTAWLAVRGRPLWNWPRVLHDLWVAKQTAREARRPQS